MTPGATDEYKKPVEFFRRTLGLLVAAAGHIFVWRHDFTPRLEVGRRGAFDGGACALTLFGWPTNGFAINAAQYLLDGLSNAFPLRVMTPALPFVNSMSDLLAANLVSPSSPVRSTARKAFDTLAEYYDAHASKEMDPPEALRA